MTRYNNTKTFLSSETQSQVTHFTSNNALHETHEFSKCNQDMMGISSKLKISVAS
jgi:hypothetical protein